MQVPGANGSGKTSLLRIICGLLAPERGEVRWQGANIRKLGEEFATSLTYLGHRNAIKEELTRAGEPPHARMAFRVHISSVKRPVNALGQTGLAGKRETCRRVSYLKDRAKSGPGAACYYQTQSCGCLMKCLRRWTGSGRLDRQFITRAHLTDGGIAIVATHHGTARLRTVRFNGSNLASVVGRSAPTESHS